MSTRRISAITIFAISLIGISAIQLRAQTAKPPMLSGKITDVATGKPIKGAKILLRFAGQNDFSMGTYADDQGIYTISWPTSLGSANLTSTTEGKLTGLVDLAATADNYEIENIYKVIIDGGKTTSQDIRLLKKPKYLQRTFTVRHRDLHEIADALGLMGPKNIRFAAASSSFTITDTEREIARIDSLLKKFDVPLKQIWLETLIIHASGADQGKPSYPKEIASVADKLGKLFRFAHYEIVGRASVLCMERGPMRFESASTDTAHLGRFFISGNVELRNQLITLKNFELSFERAPANSVMTSINIRNGETLILGASQGNNEDSAIISVVTAKIVE